MSEILLADGTLFDKLEAHKQGLQHYAFSVFLFAKNNLLLQKRSMKKYHSGGLWTNTCCSHFAGFDDLNNKEKTAARRLGEELGMDYKRDLHLVDVCEYQADVGNGLTENEIDYIFVGKVAVDVDIRPNPEEVENVIFEDFRALIENVKKSPQIYTKWLQIILASSEFIQKIEDKLKTIS